MSTTRGNSSYVIVEGPTWAAAQANAKALGGNLVTINDAAENAWLVDTFRSDYTTTGERFKWIGLTDKDAEGNWKWVSGETSSYRNWSGPQPDNNRDWTSPNGQDYAAIQWYGGAYEGDWDDKSEYSQHFSAKGIAEIPLGPTKSIFRIDGTNVWEGDTAQVLITRKGNTSAVIKLTLNTINGTASSGSDFTRLKDKTIRFGAGVRSKKISIATREDSAIESNETFKVKISSSNDLAQFSKKSATVTIEDNDRAIVNKTTNIKNITNNYNGDIYNGDVNNNNVNIGDKNTTGDINVSAGSGSINTGEWAGKVFFELPRTANISDISKKWFGSTNTARTKAHTVDITNDPQLVHVTTETWSKKVKINKIVQASSNGDTIRAEAPEKFVPAIGSVLNGGQSQDIIEGMIGWDIIDGDDGSDFIHGGNGRDVITGGSGGDELWGDFGLNTFKSEKDGQKDLVVIKSDHYVYNWLNNSYTNNPNGERTDFIEGLDSWDSIRVTCGYKHDLRFVDNVTHMGQTGIAIYLKDSLEALYTGNDLSIDQIMNMTDGDGSAEAIANRVHQYGLGWF